MSRAPVRRDSVATLPWAVAQSESDDKAAIYVAAFVLHNEDLCRI
jgi:hypothetical protein